MLSGAFRAVLHFRILVFARRSVLLVRRRCALCLFASGGADPIVCSSAVCNANLRFVAHHVRCAPHPLRTVFTKVSPFCVGACSLRFVRIFCYACFGRRAVCGRTFVFWLSVASWCCWRRWFVAVHSKQVGTLAPVLCVYFCVGTCCVVVACLVFSLCCSLLLTLCLCAFKRQNVGLGRVGVSKSAHPCFVTVSTAST